MRYTALIAVAVLSFVIAIPLTKNSAQSNKTYALPISNKVVVKVASQPVATKLPSVPAATTPTPTPTPPTCPDTQWIWASDGQCHDKPVVATPTAQPTYAAGSHEELMTAAGISSSDFGAVDYIVSHESGWRYWATEPNTGAYGECQSLPGYKMATAGDDWQTNAITQLKWCNSYAIARYGGWWAAYDYWVAHRNW